MKHIKYSKSRDIYHFLILDPLGHILAKIPKNR